VSNDLSGTIAVRQLGGIVVAPKSKQVQIGPSSGGTAGPPGPPGPSGAGGPPSGSVGGVDVVGTYPNGLVFAQAMATLAALAERTPGVYVSQYAPSGGNDGVAVQKAIDDAVTRKLSMVHIDRPIDDPLVIKPLLTQATYGPRVTFPDGIGFWAEANAPRVSSLDRGVRILCEGAGAGIDLCGGGGIAGGLRIDGQQGIVTEPADHPFRMLAGFGGSANVGAARMILHLAALRGAVECWRIEDVQNCIFDGCAVYGGAMDNMVWDHGTGGHKFFGMHNLGSGSGRYGLRITAESFGRYGVNATDGPFQSPSQIQYVAGHFESVGNNYAQIRIESGAAIKLLGGHITAVMNGTEPLIDVVEADTGAKKVGRILLSNVNVANVHGSNVVPVLRVNIQSADGRVVLDGFNTLTGPADTPMIDASASADGKVLVPGELYNNDSSANTVLSSGTTAAKVVKPSKRYGIHVARPLATKVTPGTEYRESDSGMTYRSDGKLWAAQGVGTIRKTATQTVNNSVTLVDDNALKFPIEANQEIFVEAVLKLLAVSATSDWKFGWTGPSGATAQWGPEAGGTGQTPVLFGLFAAKGATVTSLEGIANLSDTVAVGSTNSNQNLVLKGWFKNGSTPGTVTLQWAQFGTPSGVGGTPVAEDNKVLLGSFLRLTELVPTTSP
jgi:hypothetical protein